MKKGDIVYINFPFTDLSGVKMRPALVIQSLDQDVIVIFITSKIHQFNEETDLVVHPDSSNRLKTVSVFKPTKILTLSKKLVLAKTGVLDNRILELIHHKIITGLNLV
jgi:mRNA interferase MazF